MTTVEEPQHLPSALVGDRHRSLHAIKCYPAASNGIQAVAMGSGATANGWSAFGDARQQPQRTNGYSSPASWGEKPPASSSSSRFVAPAPAATGGRHPHRSHSERNGRWPKSAPPPDDEHNKKLSRSNSSLELEQEEEKSCVGALRREYGSASSIDVMSTSGESFFAMVNGYAASAVLDQRSPGPSKIAEYLRGKTEPMPVAQNAANALVNGGEVAPEDATSPRVKTKFGKLWEMSGKSKGRGGSEQQQQRQEQSLFRKLRGGGATGKCDAETCSKGSDNSLDAEMRNEEKLRRKAFGHYDVQSITANLSYASRLRGILGKRRNTTTGASAASMANRNLAGGNGSTEELGPEESDFGDGRSNDLVLSCPFFRNELGGEDERVVSLTRGVDKRLKNFSRNLDEVGGRGANLPLLHRPNLACGLAVLEGASEGHWKTRTCPYQRHAVHRENVDEGAHYYKLHFLGQEHQNWFGMDELLGPVAVSIRREKVDDNTTAATTGNQKDTNSVSSYYQYRLIIRTSELATLRGTILEDAIPNLKHGSGRSIRAREVLDYVAPELQLGCLRLGTTGNQTEEGLLKVDQQGLSNTYKVGILYCCAGQSTEEEMYNNEHAGPAFDEFLDLIGQRVRLKGFEKYRAQLDNKTDSTGFYSVYSTSQDWEIMFHVSTMLPYTPNNRQQLLRKRHIGNDIVTIVFQEPDALPFTPRSIRSQFQHVFIIVRVLSPCSDNTRYSIAVSRSKEVPVFGPPIPDNATFPKSKSFVDFLLAKVINAEHAAHRSDKFATMATRTRQEYLKDLTINHSTTTTVDTGPKFPILSFGGKKKDRHRTRFIPDATIRGAIVWQVQVDANSSFLDCFLGVSIDTLVLIDEASRDTVFACPSSAVLGWSSQTSSLRVYYHQGECIVLRTKDQDVDEIQEIVSRLSCVTPGCETQEFTLRRNSVGQLGFHVQQDGLITEVEVYGFAWKAGLRQNSRLVEICKIVVSTLSYDQMVDLLKTSLTVTVTVIPPITDGVPRRGCKLHNCRYLSVGQDSGGDYENIHGHDSDDSLKHGKASPRQQVAQMTTKSVRIDPTASPTRSTPSSGYSSRRSVTVNMEPRFRNNDLTSASSQSSEEKWYDFCEITDNEGRAGRVSGSNGVAPESINGCVGASRDGSPPPLPARLGQSSQSAFNPHNPRRREPLRSSGGGSPAYYSRLSASRSHDHGLHSGNYVQLSSASSQQQNSDSAPSLRHHCGRSGEGCNDGSLERLSDGGKMSNYSRVGQIYLSDQLTHDRLHQLRATNAPQSFPPAVNRVKPLGPSPSFVMAGEKQLESLVERCHSSRSEDEHSGSSSNSLSPRGHRRHPLPPSGTSSGSSSKNQSPRTVGRVHLDSNIEGKMRMAFLSRGPNANGMSSSSESTFQEDLLKLINPDLIDSEDAASQSADEPFKRPRTPPPIPSKTNSLDRLTRESQNCSGRVLRSSPIGTNDSPSNSPSSTNDVIFTTARPATVISSTSSSSSPAPSEYKLNREERLSPRATTNHIGALASKSMSSLPTTVMPLPDNSNSEIDWPSLVDTAAKAMEAGMCVPSAVSSLIPWIDDVSDRLGLDPLPANSSPLVGGGSGARRIRELEFRVRILEEELTKERHRKAALEMEVRNLRDENNRLQEESQTAAAQLRRFTEWFFQSINK